MQVFHFSTKLIEETILCFKEENNQDVSSEQANEYLNSFADLFLAFTKKHPVSPLWANRRLSVDDSPDLISPHNCKDK